MLLPGAVLDDKYEILKIIGKGGMSSVYLAIDIRLNKKWAVKEILKDAGSKSEMIINSIRMEADILKRADHPVLPRIVDIIYSEEAVFVVMDYIEGMPLDKVITENGPQPQDKVIEWAKNLCEALIYLHSMDPPVIYRDMKPSNIMLKPDGVVKLIDFGTAKIIGNKNKKDVFALGTRGFAAPEQFGNHAGCERFETDIRTDIYGLGITMYYMLTGIVPDTVSFELKPIRKINPSFSEGMELIIAKCTEKNPEKRYRNCQELLLHLNNYDRLDNEHRKRCRRNIRSFFVTVLVSLSFSLLALFGYKGIIRERREKYDYLMNNGYYYTVSGEYDKAAASYMNAITEVDGGRRDAYLAILKLYIHYLHEPETGLSCVAYYVEQNYMGIGEDQMLISQMAMYYFEQLKDYRTSAKYFYMLDDKGDPLTQGYKTLAVLFSDLNTDYEAYETDLMGFEKTNEDYPDISKKLLNYRLLCDAYLICYLNNTWSLEGLERCAENGLLVLGVIDGTEYDEQEYYRYFEENLIFAKEKLGDFYAVNNGDLSKFYYGEAVSECDDVLETIQENDCVEAMLCRKAKICEKLGQYNEACLLYEEAEENYESVSAYVGHLSLLCRIESDRTTNVEEWNYELLHSVYEKGKRVCGIDEDYRWKRIEIRLSPLFENNKR